MENIESELSDEDVHNSQAGTKNQSEDDLWKTGRLKTIPGHVEDYIKTKTELLKINAIEKSSDLAAKITLYAALFIVAMFVLGFISNSLAIGISTAMGVPWSGSLIVGGIYALAGMLIYIFRQQLILNPVINYIIKSAFPDENKENK